MEKIIVELSLPSTGATYDFELPAQNRVSETTQDLVSILEKVAASVGFHADQPMLLDLDRHILLNGSQYLSDAGIHDGSRLMLV